MQTVGGGGGNGGGIGAGFGIKGGDAGSKKPSFESGLREVGSTFCCALPIITGHIARAAVVACPEEPTPRDQTCCP